MTPRTKALVREHLRDWEAKKVQYSKPAKFMFYNLMLGQVKKHKASPMETEPEYVTAARIFLRIIKNR